MFRIRIIFLAIMSVLITVAFNNALFSIVVWATIILMPILLILHLTIVVKLIVIVSIVARKLDM
jgi:hypothetical protein